MSMRKLVYILLFLFCVTPAFAQSGGLSGKYVGLEKIEEFIDENGFTQPPTLEDKNYTWYHLSTLEFKNNSVLLTQRPMAIYKEDTIFSNSDGGFYFYRGFIENIKGKKLARLELMVCRYCNPNEIIFTIPIIKENDSDTANASINKDDDTSDSHKDGYITRFEQLQFKSLSIETTKTFGLIYVNKKAYRRRIAFY